MTTVRQGPVWTAEKGGETQGRDILFNSWHINPPKEGMHLMKILRLLTMLVLLTAVFATSALAVEIISPQAAYNLAATDEDTYIVDIRTSAEWQFVGHPGKNKQGEGAALEGKVVNISYMIEKKGTLVVNPSFLTEIDEIFGGKPVTLILMCRSGNRSLPAATLLADNGYWVLDLKVGFEGTTDARGYRTVNGWANDGLPYTYSGAGYQD